MDWSWLDALRYRAMLPTDDRPTVVEGRFVRAHALPASMAHLDAWLRFDFRAGLDEKGTPKANRSGWKVHLSVVPEDAGKAWDAILPIVAREALLAKVAHPSIHGDLGNPSDRQAGKLMVLYADGVRRASTPAFWRALLPRLEDALRGAGASPGWSVRGDRPVAGSAYAHVRNDKSPDGRYVSNVEAYDPFGAPSPFDGARVSSTLPKPPAVGDEESRILRALDFVAPGWEPVDDGYSLLCDDEEDAKATRRALAYVDLVASASGEAVSLASPTEARVAGGWHQAMEVRRAATLGRLLRTASRRPARLSVRPRSAGDAPAEARLVFDDPDVARQVLAGLGALVSAGGPRPSADGRTLTVPYAGTLHDGRQRERLARLSEDVAKAVRDAPTSGPDDGGDATPPEAGPPRPSPGWP